jgi:hypothetical protein
MDRGLRAALFLTFAVGPRGEGRVCSGMFHPRSFRKIRTVIVLSVLVTGLGLWAGKFDKTPGNHYNVNNYLFKYKK